MCFSSNFLSTGESRDVANACRAEWWRHQPPSRAPPAALETDQQPWQAAFSATSSSAAQPGQAEQLEGAQPSPA